MSRDSLGSVAENYFFATVINVQMRASAIHFHNMRQRVHNHFTIAIKIRAPMHHLRLSHKIGCMEDIFAGMG